MSNEKITPLTARDENEIFADLEVLCRSRGYIHAIAHFCWRDNLIQISDNNITEQDVQRRYSNDRLLTTEISTLIGLMVKGEIDFYRPQPNILQSYIDRSESLLHEMHMSLQKPWMAGFEALARSSDKSSCFDPFSSAEGLREPIFYAGDSAYSFQYEKLARLKYQADNEWLRDNVGFTIDEACLIARELGELQMRKIADLFDTIRTISPDHWTLLPGFCFSIHELVALTGIELVTIERVISALSFNQLTANALFSNLSAFNEINAAPIIKLDINTHILFQHYSLLEALYEAPFFWMAGDKSYSATASKNRGAFVEQFLVERLSGVFGQKHVFGNVDIYKGKARFGEIDGLIVYGDQAIVVQAKSKRLTIEARKGNDLQLRSDFKKAVQEAYNQAVSCSEALSNAECKFILSSGDEISFSARPAKIFPLCVVADHYPALAAQSRQFLKIHPSTAIRPPIITDVFFIDVLTEMLNSPLQLLNYIALRAKFDKQLFVSQELTTLGYHLKHNLWLEEKYNFVNLGDEFTSSLDIAMTARRLGVPGDRTPKGILTRFCGSPLGMLLSEIERCATPELVGLGMLFLQLSSDAAKHVNSGIEQLIRLANEYGRSHDFSAPSEVDKSGFTFHVNCLPAEAARQRLSTHCRIRKYDTRADTWYGVLLSPKSGRIRGAVAIAEEWKPDPDMKKALEMWPKKPMLPLSALSSQVRVEKTGRNQPCPCGSGRKYKRCCLSR